jgi:hypothetical protein
VALWKLSPSDLTFLWDECKRCFYLKVVHNFRRPWAPFPKIFGRIDRLMQAYFRDKPTSEFAPELPPGQVVFGDKWVTSVRIHLPGHEGRCYVKGKFDSVVRFDDGSYGVVDFKTTEPSPYHIPFYSRQLHAYAYALEHPGRRGLHLAPITTLGLFCVEPVAVARGSEGSIAYLGDVTWLECPKDEAACLGFLDEVLTVLERPEPPPSDPDCDHCQYRERARDVSW